MEQTRNPVLPVNWNALRARPHKSMSWVWISFGSGHPAPLYFYWIHALANGPENRPSPTTGHQLKNSIVRLAGQKKKKKLKILKGYVSSTSFPRKKPEKVMLFIFHRLVQVLFNKEKHFSWKEVRTFSIFNFLVAKGRVPAAAQTCLKNLYLLSGLHQWLPFSNCLKSPTQNLAKIIMIQLVNYNPNQTDEVIRSINLRHI